MRIFLAILFFIFLSYSISAQDSIPRNGFTILKYPSGKKSGEGFMQNGKPEGIWKAYYENGALKSEGRKTAGITDSVWNFYSLDGILKSSIEYAKGIKNGVTRTYDVNGNLVSEEQFSADKKEGLSKWFYKKNRLQKELFYSEGKEQGRGIEYDTTGQTITLLDYTNGVLVKRTPVNRTDRQERKSGMWVELYPNKSISIEASWSAGLKNGYQKQYDVKGNLLKIERYIDGVLQNQPEDAPPPPIKKRYFENGKVRTSGPYTNDGKPTGQHVNFDTSGTAIFSEIWLNGILISKGAIDSSFRKQGPWEEYYPDGTLKSKGSYLNDVKTGEWNYFFQEGQKEQIGGYKNGKPDGNWRWFYESGKTLREEKYRFGKLDGYATDYSINGDTLAFGEFVDGEREGNWFFRQGNVLIKGRFVAGEFDGEWTHFYLDSKISFKGGFNQGVPSGKHQAFRADGKLLWEGKYNGGKRDGFWKHYDDEGLIDLVVEYKDGIEQGYNGVKITPAFDPIDYENLLDYHWFRF
jgi:antitoxin component YwqK of YwqJK toxin-antitoxin module